jgi:hypothetical protein
MRVCNVCIFPIGWRPGAEREKLKVETLKGAGGREGSRVQKRNAETLKC